MSTPTINVNLGGRCLCPTNLNRARPHDGQCPANPVLVPLPIPRSVTFEVRLGECWFNTCYAVNPDGTPYSPETRGHGPGCPARPIRVSASISGKTWPESGVTQCDPHPDDLARFAVINDAYAMAYATCRERWALVKALVTGQSPTTTERKALLVSAHYNGMVGTRDAVFSALAGAAHHAVARNVALNRAIEAAELEYPYSEELDEDSEPALVLADYVKRLIEQVGVLGDVP